MPIAAPKLAFVTCPGWGTREAGSAVPVSVPETSAPPAGPGADTTTTMVALTHRMGYWQWGSPSAGHVIVCVHGLTRQGRDFDVLAQALVQRAGGNVRVVCPDVAGRGTSDWLADANGYQVPAYAGDMVALLAQVHVEAPIARLDWVGTSMGGLIGLVVAGQPGLPLPTPVAHLVLNDVGPEVSWQGIQRIQNYVGQTGQFASVEAAAAAMWAVSQGFGPHTPEQWLALSRPMVRPLPNGGCTLHYDPALAVPVRAATEDATRQGSLMLWALYDQIQAKTLVLRGADSDLLTAEVASTMSTRGPLARVATFAGVGHAPTLIAKDQVLTIADFLFESE